MTYLSSVSERQNALTGKLLVFIVCVWGGGMSETWQEEKSLCCLVTSTTVDFTQSIDSQEHCTFSMLLPHLSCRLSCGCSPKRFSSISLYLFNLETAMARKIAEVSQLMPSNCCYQTLFICPGAPDKAALFS